MNNESRRPGFPRNAVAVASLIASLAVCGAGSLLPLTAAAQIAPGTPDKVFSSGPFRMHDGEKLTFGMLLPAVQKARANAHFVLTNGDGATIFTYPPDPGRAAFIDVTYHAKPVGDQRGPSFEITHGIGNPDFVPAGTDGILIGLLLPAIDRAGQTVGPITASMQSFNASGATMTHSFLNGFQVPGTPD